jgi:hypothetical protein
MTELETTFRIGVIIQIESDPLSEIHPILLF